MLSIIYILRNCNSSFAMIESNSALLLRGRHQYRGTGYPSHSLQGKIKQYAVVSWIKYRCMKKMKVRYCIYGISNDLGTYFYDCDSSKQKIRKIGFCYLDHDEIRRGKRIAVLWG